MNEISDTEPTNYNLRIPERETHPVERTKPKTKGQVYMQSYELKKINTYTKKEPTIRFLEQNKENQDTKRVHKQHGRTNI